MGLNGLALGSLLRGSGGSGSDGWALAGLGHCGSRAEQRLETNLQLCLQHCQESVRCSYASFLDTTVVREGSRSLTWGLCWIYGTCPKLLSTLPGFATFRRRRLNDVGSALTHREEEPPMASKADPEPGSWGAAVEATRAPHVEVTLALSPSLAESLKDRFEHRQLCVALRDGRNPRLLAKAPGSCNDGEDASAGASLFQVRRVQSAGESGEAALRRSVGPQELVSVLVEISWRDHKLCVGKEGPRNISLSRDCGAGAGGAGGAGGAASLWELQRAGEGHESLPSEPCLWLKAKSQEQGHENQQSYLALQDWRDLVLVSWPELGAGGCWHMGGKQTWTEQHFEKRETAESTAGRSSVSAVVWLMASESYSFALKRLLSSFRQAGEAVRVQVRWVPDMKDTQKEGFKLMGGFSPSYKVFYFNYAKYLFLFEALLEAVTAEETPLLVVMDLDVQVFPGWTSTLRRCLVDDGLKQSEEEKKEEECKVPSETGADVCFLQQAAFGDGRLQQANSGVLVFGSGKGGPASSQASLSLGRFGALLGALVQRLQSQEVLAQLLPSSEPVAFEQLHLNYVLNFIRKHVERPKERDLQLRVVRWGIYSPLVAYAGMFLTHAILTDTVHHATASNVNLKEKLRFLEAAKLMSEDFRQLCPLNFEGKIMLESGGGPLREFCFYFTAKDPHFGPLLPHHKLFQGFSEEDNGKVLEHLISRAKGRKAWIQLIIHFNERGYKRWCKARQNTSQTLRTLLELPY
ncbi:DD3-3 [Symbiodinium sp. CCMP2592]|nr:DD3-3 [Symbiodinium sp. CCMP2592]